MWSAGRIRKESIFSEIIIDRRATGAQLPVGKMK